MILSYAPADYKKFKDTYCIFSFICSHHLMCIATKVFINFMSFYIISWFYLSCSDFFCFVEIFVS
jgi:hypothetical protein